MKNIKTSIIIPLRYVNDGQLVYKKTGQSPLTHVKNPVIYSDGLNGRVKQPIDVPENMTMLVSLRGQLNLVPINLEVRLDFDSSDSAINFLSNIQD